MSYFHPEEESQVWALEGYETAHRGTRYLIEFADTESYVCVFFAAFDSENSGELDIEDDNPLYDEFHQAVLRIVEVRSGGLRPYEQYLTLDYRDWPEHIIDIDTGTVVYPTAPA